MRMTMGLALCAVLVGGCACEREAASALAFTGEKAGGVYVEAPAGTEQTFACWFKALGCGKGDKPYDRIVQAPQWYLHTCAGDDSVDSFTFGYTGASGKIVGNGLSVSAVFGAWQHVAVTFSKDGFRFYLNGKGQKISGGDLPAELKAGLACLGNSAPGGNRPFKGQIAGARFWSRALDGADIARLADEDPDGLSLIHI